MMLDMLDTRIGTLVVAVLSPKTCRADAAADPGTAFADGEPGCAGAGT
jgi:hypothetical protein